MNIEKTVKGDVSTFTISKGARPVPYALCFLALATILQTVNLIVTEELKLTLVILLVCVAGSCVALAAVTLDEVASAEVAMDEQEIRWKSLLTSRSAQWREVTDVALVDAGGSFSSTSLVGGISSIGVALTLMSPKPGQPEEQQIIMAGTADIAEDLMRVVESIKAARRQTMIPQANNPRRIAKPVTPKGEFRRRPTSSPTSIRSA